MEAKRPCETRHGFFLRRMSIESTARNRSGQGPEFKRSEPMTSALAPAGSTAIASDSTLLWKATLQPSPRASLTMICSRPAFPVSRSAARARNRESTIHGVALTLTSTTSRHYERYKIGERCRRLTNVEYARIQGFPDDHCSACSVYDQYALYGNAVPPPMAAWVIQRLLSGGLPAADYRKRARQRSLFDHAHQA